MKFESILNNQDFIISRFNKRDTLAFATVYSQLYSQLIYFTSNIYRGTEIEPTDIVHDAIIRLWQLNGIKFDSIDNIKAYLVVTIKNQFKNYVIHKKYEDKYKDFITDEENYFIENIIESNVYSFVNEMIDFLPEKSADILKFHLDGWTNQDIADKLSISERTVRYKKTEAVSILRKIISNDK